jgi:UDP:flavonoid glycosyltransferase YjiC (YdhE family)
VGARISWNGVGVDLKTDNPSPPQVAAAVKRVLADAAFKENAKRIGAEMRALGGVDQACDLLEALVKTKEVVRRTESLPPRLPQMSKQSANGALASNVSV